MSEAPRHTYTRPSWLCTICGEEWPCAPRRQAFLERFPSGDDRMRLRGILGVLVIDAEKDLRAPHWTLNRRFIDWTM